MVYCCMKATIAIGLIFACFLITQAQDDVKRKQGNTCVKDLDCPDNAFCKRLTAEERGYCECKDDYILRMFNSTHRECLKEARNLGDVCSVDIQCQKRLSVNSECKDGACQCKEGAHFDDARCYATAIIGQKCTVTQNCYLGPDESFGNQAFCIKGLCSCNILHSPRDGGTRCLKDAVLGDICEDDQHCSGDNVRCNSVCRCEEDYVVHPDEFRCLRAAAALNDACEIEAQCTAKLNGTTCLDQQCRCQWGAHLADGSCILSKYSGQRCTMDQECLTEANEPGQCVKEICTCKGCQPYSDSGAMSSFKTSAFLITAVVVVSTTVQQTSYWS